MKKKEQRAKLQRLKKEFNELDDAIQEKFNEFYDLYDLNNAVCMKRVYRAEAYNNVIADAVETMCQHIDSALFDLGSDSSV